MKRKNILFILTFLLSVSVYAQTNYYGISGNMVSGDFDNDGFNDDIAAFNTSSELPVLNLWISDNGWVSEKTGDCNLPFGLLDSKSLNSKIVSGDFDNDGFVDDLAAIYEIGYNKTSVTVWINTEGKFVPGQWWYGADFDANQTNNTLVSGDFDNDGFIDDIAAFYDYEQKKTKVYLWKSDGKKFAWPGTWWIGNDFNSTRIQGTLVSGDFDHDGFVDDMAAFYNYADNFCKIFVWTSVKNKFQWPYTWYAKENFTVNNTVGNVVSGDFNNNGYLDDIAAIYNEGNEHSSVLVFERNKNGFTEPTIWWYGDNEAVDANSRLVVSDLNQNNNFDQFSGLEISGTTAKLKTWTALNSAFHTPEENWNGLALSIEDCDEEGNCLSNDLSTNFQVYPNPSNGKFSVEIPKSNNPEVQVLIFNMLGSQVKSIKTTSGQVLSIDLSSYEAGTYMVQVLSNEINLKKSLVIE